MVADAGGTRSGDSIHRAFEGLVDDGPFQPPPPVAPAREEGPDGGRDQVEAAARDAAEAAARQAAEATARQAAEAAARQVAEVAADQAAAAERLDHKIDALAALVERARPDDAGRVDALRQELRSAVTTMAQQLQSELGRISQGLAQETAEIRGELQGLAADLYRGGPPAAPSDLPADGLHRLQAEVAAQRKQLRAELEAAISSIVDPRSDTWRGLRGSLEVLLAGSAERLRAEVAHDQDEFRAEMRATLSGVLERQAQGVADRLSALERALAAESRTRSRQGTGPGLDEALAAHTRALEARIGRLEESLTVSADNQRQEAVSTRMELRAEVQAVLAAALGQQGAALDALRTELEQARRPGPSQPPELAPATADLAATVRESLAGQQEAVAAEVLAALAAATARQAAAWEEGLANVGERLREELEAHRREQAAAFHAEVSGQLSQTEGVIHAAVRSAVADAAEAQARVLGHHSLEVATAAASTTDRVLEELAALRSESATLVEGALAAVIRQQGQAWEARRAELEAALADTFERVQKVIADEREALELVRQEVVAARLDDPQRMARLETAVGDLGRRMAELSVATVEATSRQVEELRQVQTGIFENSRQLYAVLAEEGEQAGAEMRSLLRQAQRVLEDSRQDVRAEIADAVIRITADQERRFHVQATAVDDALARNAGEHDRHLERQTAALEAILHAFGQRLAEDRRAADLSAQAVAGEMHQRLQEVAAASARASASAEAALAELRATQERAVSLDELREAVGFLREELARVQRMVSARDRYALAQAPKAGAAKARPTAKKAPARKRTAS
ncbi:MAG: hypothetical protein ACLGI2_12470 [Acidimicrobiia bacterium]